MTLQLFGIKVYLLCTGLYFILFILLHAIYPQNRENNSNRENEYMCVVQWSFSQSQSR